MDRSSVYEINNRSVTADAAYLNRLATEAQEGARVGSLKDIGLFVVLAEQAWDATRREIGMRYWTEACRGRPDE